jgi:hypothetical protein
MPLTACLGFGQLLAHFAHFNICGRRVRLWRVQETSDSRLIAHGTWTVVDPERSWAGRILCGATMVPPPRTRTANLASQRSCEVVW